ncbi:MAG: glycine rich domain-containing protein [Mycoplasmatota bacterium]
MKQKNNMKKGFTLIELLAVLVILVVIAAIATPIVMGIIEESKTSADITTVNNLAVAAEQLYARAELNGEIDELILSNNIFDKVEMSNKPSNAIITIDSDGIITVVFEKDEKCYIKIGEEDVIFGDMEDGKCDSYFVDYIGTEYVFEYSGDYQLFVVPMSGYYNLEAWGAQGGGNGGYGSYVAGTIHLAKDEKIYIYVGSQGVNGTGGYNGGGDVINNSYAGGGATDFRLEGGEWDSDTSLSSRILVAGAGGGYGAGNIGGNAGGLIGYNGLGDSYGIGATQTEGGKTTQSQYYETLGSFGKGGIGNWNKESLGGGGSGYYGGGPGNGAYLNGSGAGGSSYISGHTGCVAITSLTDQTPKSGCVTGTTDNECSLHYSDKLFTDTVMIDGSGYSWTNEKGTQILMPTPSGSEYELGIGNVGDGYAQITYLGISY